jgi:hypothetical protein
VAPFDLGGESRSRKDVVRPQIFLDSADKQSTVRFPGPKPLSCKYVAGEGTAGNSLVDTSYPLRPRFAVLYAAGWIGCGRSFRAAETILGVNFKRTAMVFRVT